jgi:hypothetical protein
MGSVQGRENPKLAVSPVPTAFAIFAIFANFTYLMSRVLLGRGPSAIGVSSW